MISYHTSSERLYYFLSVDVKHIVIICESQRMFPKNLFSHCYFLNMHIIVTGICTS